MKILKKSDLLALKDGFLPASAFASVKAQSAIMISWLPWAILSERFKVRPWRFDSDFRISIIREIFSIIPEEDLRLVVSIYDLASSAVYSEKTLDEYVGNDHLAFKISQCFAALLAEGYLGEIKGVEFRPHLLRMIHESGSGPQGALSFYRSLRERDNPVRNNLMLAPTRDERYETLYHTENGAAARFLYTVVKQKIRMKGEKE